MHHIRHLGRKAIAVFIAFSIVQIYVQANLASSIAAALTEATTSPSQQVTGKLFTTDNKPIVVNGNKTAAGTTILDGAMLETPEGVGATVIMGPLGEVDLAPNTLVTLHYVPEQQSMIHYGHGQRPVVNVKLKRGCAIVRVNQGVLGSIETPDGTVTLANQPDSDNRMRADVCFPDRATTPIVNANAAANAGAGAGGGSAGAAGGGGGLFGLGTGGTIALVAGVAAVITTLAIVIPCDRGQVSSPGAPLGECS